MQRLAIFLCFITVMFAGLKAPASPLNESSPEAIQMDVFVRGDRESSIRVNQFVDVLRKQEPWLEIHVHDVLVDRSQLANLYAIARKVGREKPTLPAFNCCDRTYFGFVDQPTSGPEIESLYTADVYTRASCPRCQNLKTFLPIVKKRWPAIRFRVYEVDDDAGARSRWQALCVGSGMTPGLPTIDFARRVMIGYQGDEVTGVQLTTLIESVARTDRQEPKSADQSSAHSGQWRQWRQWTYVTVEGEDQTTPSSRVEQSDISELLELPEETDSAEIGEVATESKSLQSEGKLDSIQVPYFGRLRVNDLGMPLFTLAIGLVDGFNPCAMWVLVFLLSVLVNIRDRKKILIIAGTFVGVSGLAYFAFMAAWLNLFLLVGIVRPVQIALGLLALFIGVVNVKDFFAFKRGFSLSISDTQKPGIYRRVREIVNAKYLSVALGGAVILAVIVNMVELLCTAGLPALYTQILTVQGFPPWENYLYLALYILAYMFDDAILVGVVVMTLSHRKLQEKEGRWLKLLSGLVILVIGLVMIFRPEWLQLNA